jgi:hypothetical protein
VITLWRPLSTITTISPFSVSSKNNAFGERSLASSTESYDACSGTRPETATADDCHVDGVEEEEEEEEEDLRVECEECTCFPRKQVEALLRGILSCSSSLERTITSGDRTAVACRWPEDE